MTARALAALGTLSVSQRLVIGLCAALILVSFLWLLSLSTRPDLVPVLDQSYSYEALADAETVLKAEKIDYEIRGQRIYVRSENRDNAIRILHEGQVIPEDGVIDLDRLMTDVNPFLPESDRASNRAVAKSNTLARIFLTSPLVADVKVVINEKLERRVGFQHDVPTASVMVTMAAGRELSKAQVEGFASLVARSVAGLDVHDVSVVDARTLRAYRVPRPDEVSASDHLDQVKQNEDHLLAKLYHTLGYIQGLLATVTVELENTHTRKETQVFDKPTVKTSENQENSSNSRAAAAEPGSAPNLGAGLEAGGEAAGTSNERRRQEFYPGQVAEKQVVQQTAPGIKRVTAAISIPRSHVMRVYQTQYPDVQKPSAEQLSDAMTIIRQEVLAGAAKALMADPKDIEVSFYADLDKDGLPLHPGLASAAPVSEAVGTVGWAQAHLGELGLGLLALVAIVTLARVTRRSTEMARAVPVETLRPEEVESVGAAVEEAEVYDGAVALSGGVLEGREVEEASVRAQQLAAEVSKLIDNDPEEAVGIVKDWINQGK